MCCGRVSAATLLATLMALCCIPSAIEGQDERLMEDFFGKFTEFQEELDVESSTNDIFSDMEQMDSVMDMLKRYDFVIVGASPSGCVLANRLSENPEWKVLLLEAGERENIFVKIPVFAAYLQSTSYNWGYVAERQNYSCWGE